MDNTETMKKVYLLAQEHCGLKVGDWVRVTRKAENYEAGWDYLWKDEKDNFIGKIGIINSIGDFGIDVELPKRDYTIRYDFPYFVLEKVEKPAHEFKPFDKVLVRDGENKNWRCDFYSYKDNAGIVHCTGKGGWWQYCIPYEGNEHLVGTTDMPEE